ncbi:30S ribosomal protein S17e [Candidatus Woesearchaeota archaeon]|jgi:small subunit ribosomal protein S17e|nr:30S ribosomal protein S17e [Candidatus Woesearchaeota archaeon]MBT6023547.1 30S ribosomal protein S17e [Candidatus Woesearchaeota archaeon]
MGRIRTKFTKRIVDQLLAKHGAKFTDNFNKNKAVVQELSDVRTKKIRNQLAGYATKKVKLSMDE